MTRIVDPHLFSLALSPSIGGYLIGLQRGREFAVGDQLEAFEVVEVERSL